MSITFLAFYAPTRTLLTMLRSIASCRSLVMATPSSTMQMSLRTRVAVLVAKSHMRTLCGMSFREAADAVLFPTALEASRTTLRLSWVDVSALISCARAEKHTV